jgi:hypothetical protein
VHRSLTLVSLFEGLIGRAYNKAKKRVDEALIEQADDAKQRLARVANVLDAILNAHERDEGIEAAIAAVTTWEALSADTQLLRRSSRTGMVDVLSELRREHYVFKAIGPRLLDAVSFQSTASAAPLLDALAIIKGLGVDTRKPLPDKVPETIVERSWRPHVFKDGGIDRQYYELAVYFALGTALRAGDVDHGIEAGGGPVRCRSSHEGGGLTFAARSYDPRTRRVVDCLTTEPGVQVYTGNGLNRSLFGSSGTT